MKKFIFSIWSFISAAVFLFLPAVSSAQLSKAYEQLSNPLPSDQLICYTAVCDLQQMFLIIIRDILQLIPIVSVLFIIIGGFQMVASAGNEERLIKAKKTITWAVLGLVFALMSFSIVAIVKNMLGVNS